MNLSVAILKCLQNICNFMGGKKIHEFCNGAGFALDPGKAFDCRKTYLDLKNPWDLTMVEFNHDV